ARVAAGAAVGARLRDRGERLRGGLADAFERAAAERRQAVGRRRLSLERLLIARDQALDLLAGEAARLLGSGLLAGELVLRELAASGGRYEQQGGRHHERTREGHERAHTPCHPAPHHTFWGGRRVNRPAPGCVSAGGDEAMDRGP